MANLSRIDRFPFSTAMEAPLLKQLFFLILVNSGLRNFYLNSKEARVLRPAKRVYTLVTRGSCVDHLTHLYISDGVRNVMTSSSQNFDQRCFDCFCGRFGNQEMLLAITFDGRNIFLRAMKQFGPVALSKSR